MEKSTSSFLESSVEYLFTVSGQPQQRISLPKTESDHYCISSKEKDTNSWQCLDCIASQNSLPSRNSSKNNLTDGGVITWRMSWSRFQWVILLMCTLANFGCAVCQSLQAPFFPFEAAAKHVRSSVYGFVFGAFSLVVFILAPIFGIYVGKIGPKFLLNGGIFVTSTCCILFGLVGKIQSGNTFVAYAFLVRIVEAVGDAAFNTASYTVLAKTFPNDIGITYALLRSSFGAGLIIGPAIGGILYEVGGFPLPFTVMGSFLFIIAIIMVITLWDHPDGTDSKEEPSIAKAIRIPSVVLALVAVCFGAFSIGFLSTTLEPHLRQFVLSPVEVASMFIVSGGVYAITAVMWGKLLNGILHPKLVIALGIVFLCNTYMFIGPAPFIDSETAIWMCIVALAFHGLGVGGQLLGAHIEALNKCTENGFSESYETNGMVAGLWASAFQLGNFIGPSIGGIMLDSVGFRNASLVPLIIHILLACVITGCYTFIDRKKVAKKVVDDETTCLISSLNDQA